MRRLLVYVAIGFMVVAYFGGKKEFAHSPYHSSRSAKQAVAYAKQQLGKPYLWAAAGPDAFDCSGLTYRAWGLPGSQRTSEQQWAAQQHVSHPRPGDLVYFHGVLLAGEQPPGHVGIVIGKNLMIDGYGRGTVMRVESFGRSTSAPGLQQVMGFTRP